jgi:hypothetical protein
MAFFVGIRLKMILDGKFGKSARQILKPFNLIVTAK